MIFFVWSILTFILWQRIRRLIFIFSWSISLNKIIILAALTIKTGMPPLLIWVLQVNWKWLGWIIFLTWQKCLPFLILLYIWISSYLLLTWPFFALRQIFWANEWFSLIWASSLRDRAWVCLRNSWKAFWYFFTLYTVIWVLWAQTKLHISLKFEHRLTRTIFFLVLALPPRIFFFLKLQIWITLEWRLGVIIRAVRWGILIFYWKWIFLTFQTNRLFKNNKNFETWLIVIRQATLFLLL